MQKHTCLAQKGKKISSTKHMGKNTIFRMLGLEDGHRYSPSYAIFNNQKDFHYDTSFKILDELGDIKA